MRQNEREIEQEQEKWERYKRDQEKKIRREIDAEVDSKLSLFKDKLSREENSQLNRISENQ